MLNGSLITCLFLISAWNCLIKKKGIIRNSFYCELQKENDSMNLSIIIRLCTGVVCHMDEFHWEMMGGNQDTQAHYFFFLYNIKQQWPHPFDTPDGNPCSTLRSFCLNLNVWAEIFSCHGSRPILCTIHGRKREEHGGRRIGWFEDSDESVFALLWFFVRPVRWPRFGTRLLGRFLRCSWTWPPGSFGCARRGRSGRTNIF